MSQPTREIGSPQGGGRRSVRGEVPPYPPSAGPLLASDRWRRFRRSGARARCHPTASRNRAAPQTRPMPHGIAVPAPAQHQHPGLQLHHGVQEQRSIRDGAPQLPPLRRPSIPGSRDADARGDAAGCRCVDCLAPGLTCGFTVRRGGQRTLMTLCRTMSPVPLSSSFLAPVRWGARASSASWPPGGPQELAGHSGSRPGPGASWAASSLRHRLPDPATCPSRRTALAARSAPGRAPGRPLVEGGFLLLTRVGVPTGVRACVRPARPAG